MSEQSLKWPKQSECNEFYGNPHDGNGRPSAQWEAENLVRIAPPFTMYYNTKPIQRVTIHKKCAPSLQKILANLWEFAKHDQSVIDNSGVSIYGGCYNFRRMRSGFRLSMHAYACAIDLDPARNGWKDPTPRFLQFPWVVDAFEDEGWVWGGRWSEKSRDGMHFQAARVG